MSKGFFGFEDIIGTGGWAIIILVFLATIGGGGTKLLPLLIGVGIVTYLATHFNKG
jgi:hypothetical protein